MLLGKCDILYFLLCLSVKYWSNSLMPRLWIPPFVAEIVLPGQIVSSFTFQILHISYLSCKSRTCLWRQYCVLISVKRICTFDSVVLLRGSMNLFNFRSNCLFFSAFLVSVSIKFIKSFNCRIGHLSTTELFLSPKSVY